MLLCPRDSPARNTGVGGHFLLQGIFSTQGFEPASPELAGGFFTSNATWKAPYLLCNKLFHVLVTSLVAQMVKRLSTMWETRV